MPVTFWTTQGTIEVLGNATVQQDGTKYSVVRLRRPDGGMQTLTDLVVSKRCHVLVAAGAEVALTGFDLEGQSVLVALKRDGEVLDDMQTVEEAQRALRRAGRLTMALALVMAWTIVVPAVLFFPASRALRNARGMPSKEEMQRQVHAMAQA